MKHLSLFIYSLFFSITVTAQRDTLQHNFDQLSEKMYAGWEDKSGCYVLAVQHHEVLYQNTYGLANMEHQVPISDSTIFDLASLAKMFTGYAIAHLEESGKLSTHDDIRTYLTDFPEYEHKITIGHLVHHTSGVRNWTSLLHQAGWSFQDKLSFEKIIDLIYAQQGLDFTPGSQYRYSNSGYNLLVQIIEKITGESYTTWMQKHVFDPLQMTHTLFKDSHGQIIPNLASGYYLDQDRNDIIDVNNLTAVGSSSLFSNGPDMRKWMDFLLHPPKDKQKIIERMFTTDTLSNGEINTYAYGISVDTYRGKMFINHSGSWASNTSHLAILPEYDAGIFIVHNYRTRTSNKIEAYADLFIGNKEEETPQTPSKDEDPDIKIPNEVLDQYTGTYKLGIAWYLTISKKDDRLYAKANGEGTFQMFPINSTTFRVPAYGNRTIEFLKNDAGQIDALQYNGEKRERWNEQFEYDPIAMKPYAGTYFNHELGLLLKVQVKEDALYATNVKTGITKLVDTGDDYFFGDGISSLRRILFHRDQQGKIIGFYVTNTRGELKRFFQKAH